MAALETLYLDGQVRAIGTSNFKPHHLEPLMNAAEILPMVNQIELHPGCNQEATRDFCNRNDIVVEAWSPLGAGRVLENQLLIDIAASYGCTVAQLCIRWCLQRRAIPLPKSTDAGRISENARVFWFNITDEDLQRIDELDPLGQKRPRPGHHRLLGRLPFFRFEAEQGGMPAISSPSGKPLVAGVFRPCPAGGNLAAS